MRSPGTGLGAAERIRATVDAIPAGRVSSYGRVAAEAGLPGRARLVGRVLRELEPGSGVPWHRVLNARGEVAVRGASAEAEQLRRLGAEGVRPGSNGRVDLDRFGWP